MSDELTTRVLTCKELAEILSVSERRIQQLAKEKVIPYTRERPYRFILRDAITGYVNHLQHENRNGAPTSDKERKEKADADWKETKAKMLDLEYQALQGKYHRAEDIEALVSDLILVARAGILSLPGKLAMAVAPMTDPARCSERIRRECNLLLDQLSQYEYSKEAYIARELERRGDTDYGEDDA